LEDLPKFCDKVHLDPHGIIFTDYLTPVEAWIPRYDWREGETL